jgi:hypothetical protein
MNFRFLSLSATALVFCISDARADYVTTFATPPYTVDQSVIGLDGWEYRLPTKTDDAHKSRVVAVRWNDYKPAMMMKGVNLKNSVPPTTGGKVKITFDLAVNFPEMGGALKQFRMGFIGAPCGEIFMDLAAEGGLGYQADGSGRGGVVALKKSEIKINSFYSYSIAIDYTNLTYDVTITGLKKDDTVFKHKVEGVAFESKAKSVSTIYILSGGALTAYLSSMAIKSE